jgi:hypothetical protein
MGREVDTHENNKVEIEFPGREVGPRENKKVEI